MRCTLRHVAVNGWEREVMAPAFIWRRWAGFVLYFSESGLAAAAGASKRQRSGKRWINKFCMAQGLYPCLGATLAA